MLELPEEHERLASIAGYILTKKLKVLANWRMQAAVRSLRKLTSKDITPVLETMEALGWLGRTRYGLARRRLGRSTLQSTGEGLSLLGKGVGMHPALNCNRKAGLAPWPAGSIPMERLSAPERTREELRALMNGDLGDGGRPGAIWCRWALRLIVEEALEGEVADVLGRERYERGDGRRPATAMAIGRAR